MSNKVDPTPSPFAAVNALEALEKLDEDIKILTRAFDLISDASAATDRPLNIPNEPTESH